MMRYDEAVVVFDRLFKNEMSENEAKDFLVQLYNDGETGEQIAAAALVMRSHSIKLHLAPELVGKLVDVVGTGGDKSGTFNISSTVAIVLASLGCFVAKHGNRAITSNSGSADMLEALGINLSLSPNEQIMMLEESGFAFMFAQNHHPAMKHIMPIRKSLPHRTIFNILGPLTNPAGADKILLGVFSKEFLDRITEASKYLKSPRTMAVSSADGLDEISVCDITYCSFLNGDEIRDFQIDPREYGLSLHPSEAIKGGDAQENAKTTLSILSNIEKGAKRDIVLLNAAAALMVEGSARDIQDGLQMADEAIGSKRAYKKLNQIIELSQKLS
jgi:anthranilate phosphoribosyltransferase